MDNIVGIIKCYDDRKFKLPGEHERNMLYVVYHVCHITSLFVYQLLDKYYQ